MSIGWESWAPVQSISHEFLFTILHDLESKKWHDLYMCEPTSAPQEIDYVSAVNWKDSFGAYQE